MARKSALERKSSVGATLLYGVRRCCAAFDPLITEDAKEDGADGAESTGIKQSIVTNLLIQVDRWTGFAEDGVS